MSKCPALRRPLHYDPSNWRAIGCMARSELILQLKFGTARYRHVTPLRRQLAYAVAGVATAFILYWLLSG